MSEPWRKAFEEWWRAQPGQMNAGIIESPTFMGAFAAGHAAALKGARRVWWCERIKCGPWEPPDPSPSGVRCDCTDKEAKRYGCGWRWLVDPQPTSGRDEGFWIPEEYRPRG